MPPAPGHRTHLTRPQSRVRVRGVIALCASAALLLAPMSPTQLASAEVAGTQAAAVAAKAPPVPGGLPSGIEAPASYVPANSCSPKARAGTVKLGKLLTSTYPNTRYGGARACGLTPNSEHHDGRAVDWMNSVRNKTQAAQAKAVVSWLLATDSRGNRYANARRLGVMYVIWDNKIWSAYAPDRGWREYNNCLDRLARNYDTTCHRDHMHISLSYAGATGRTSFWSDKVAAPDYGPCRPKDLNWAYSYKNARSTPCPRYAKVQAKSGASSLSKTLTSYSGRYLKQGYTGGPVTAIQKAIKIKANGRYDSTTVTAVKKWQRAHKVSASGTINHQTWRALLKATK